MNIIFQKNIIELNATEARKAAKIGTEENRQLLEAKSNFPNFQIRILPTRKSSYDFKGLTYEFMERYISTHDTEEQLNEFNKKRNISGEAPKADSYGEIKQWFLESFPQILAASASKKNKGVA